jgi:hypothetical protein
MLHMGGIQVGGYSRARTQTRGKKQILGGEGGIRTHGRLAPTPDFESGTFDHSATSPGRKRVLSKDRDCIRTLLPGETPAGQRLTD